MLAPVSAAVALKLSEMRAGGGDRREAGTQAGLVGLGRPARDQVLQLALMLDRGVQWIGQRAAARRRGDQRGFEERAIAGN